MNQEIEPLPIHPDLLPEYGHCLQLENNAHIMMMKTPRGFLIQAVYPGGDRMVTIGLQSKEALLWLASVAKSFCEREGLTPESVELMDVDPARFIPTITPDHEDNGTDRNQNAETSDEIPERDNVVSGDFAKGPSSPAGDPPSGECTACDCDGGGDGAAKEPEAEGPPCCQH